MRKNTGRYIDYLNQSGQLRKYIWIFITIFLGIGYLTVKSLSKSIEHWNIRNKDYSLASSGNFHGIINENFEDRGSSFVIINDTTKIWFPCAENLKYQPSLMCYFIQIGDSIAKREGSDTVFIFRDRILYYFVLKRKITK
jgi:hypothetical protein